MERAGQEVSDTGMRRVGKKGLKLGRLVAVASEDFDLADGLSGVDDVGGGQEFGAGEGGADGGGRGTALGVVGDIEGVFLSEEAGAIGLAGVVAGEVGEGVGPVGGVLDGVDAGVGGGGPEAGGVGWEGLVEGGGEAPVGGDDEVAAFLGGFQLGIDEDIRDEAPGLGPAALGAGGIAGEEMQVGGIGAVETGFEGPGEAGGADEVGIDEEDALESGEDEGDGAPTDAVFGLEEGADDELMASEHGGEDEPGGPAGVWPGGLGAPEEIGEG